VTTRAAVVHAPCGTVVGLEIGGVRRFLGVPYAESPVGELRFAAPRPRADFAAPFDASSFGATPQRVPYSATTTIPEPSIAGDDILTLNVFAAATRAEPLPVMVWLHGGGYVAGSAASPWYDGRSFVRDGVVVVTVAYRLALDGFGALLDAPTNLAIRDVLTALGWVRRNIAAFGGDPGRVTLAGQSAGGGLVLAVLAAPASEGLVHRAIVASGIDIVSSLERARAATAELAAALGVTADRAGLASVTDHDIQLAVQPDADMGVDADEIRPRPVVGDDVLPLPFTEALGRYSLSVPLLLGATEDEFDAGAPDPAARATGTRVTDALFRSVIPRVAAARRGATAGTWAWSFDWPSPVYGGAAHCIDLPFFFDLLDAEGVPAALGAHPPRDLATAVHGEVVRFIHGVDPDWPRAHGALGDAARSYGRPGQPVATVERGAFDPVVAPGKAA
jgi:carboxylesterase type B